MQIYGYIFFSFFPKIGSKAVAAAAVNRAVLKIKLTYVRLCSV